MIQLQQYLDAMDMRYLRARPKERIDYQKRRWDIYDGPDQAWVECPHCGTVLTCDYRPVRIRCGWCQKPLILTHVHVISRFGRHQRWSEAIKSDAD